MAYIDYADEVVFAGKPYKKFPLILNNNHIINRLTLKYFLSQRVVWGARTLYTYTKHICDFISQLEVENQECTFDHIDDDWLEAYAHQIWHRNPSSTGGKYISQLLFSVIHFLVWCESNNYCNNLIGSNANFRIRVRQTKNGFTHNLIKYYEKQKSPPKIAPRDEWIEKLLSEEHFRSEDLEIRFNLMVEWGRSCGLRAHEICELSIDQIPSRETLEQSIIEKKNIFIELTVTKGRKKARIPVSGILLKQTLDYIESERNQLITKFKKKARIERKAYIPPHQVFISSRTGQALHYRTFSNQLNARWRKAVENGNLTKNQHVWVHGLRHRFATDKLKEITQLKYVRDPHQVTKTLTRHSHSSTLDIYTASIHLEDMYD
jgi:integrase